MGTSANGSPDGPGVITVTASRSYEVRIESGQITGLSIYNDTKGCRAFVFATDK